MVIRKTSLALVLAVALPLAAGALLLDAPAASAQDAGVCATADALLAATGQGDRDHDGLSNCRERNILGTSPRDYDSDDDSVADGDEVAAGTVPTDADSDDDGLDDGREEDLGSDPTSADSDGDGEGDGEDVDPTHELKSAISGSLQSISCPASEGAGGMSVLGISMTLNADTDFDGVDSCDALATAFAAHGAHVSVEVSGDASTALVAEKVSIRDADNDGSPDDVDDDDDDDGTDDEHDDD